MQVPLTSLDGPLPVNAEGMCLTGWSYDERKSGQAEHLCHLRPSVQQC